MKSTELRDKFLAFFEAKDHVIIPSHSLIPDNDNTLLWINAGVAPLKKYFSKQAIPPSSRMANSQKSIRTSDIENVGKSERHHTMFEMLGNFSIDDYFKKEAIDWAWEFLVEEIGLAPEKLFVTVHPDDDEARQLWMDIVGLPAEKIFDDPENFWEIGPGPCGPNSEIYFDKGDFYGCNQESCQPGCDCDRYIEIWNLVFTQYNREIDGTLTKLSYNNIDTGMSLERLASVVQGVSSNFEIDIFMPLIEEIEKLSGYTYQDQVVAMRVISDHIRAVTFAVADGALPSNEGRGYVIRRVLRRAIRFAKKIGLDKPFMYRLVKIVANVMGQHYEYLYDKINLIERVVKSEEERFLVTLEEGEKLLFEHIEILKSKKENILSGEEAFKLYDTYGFPLELTIEIAGENDIEVDKKGFSVEMEKQRERARAASKVEKGNVVAKEIFPDVKKGNLFVGYDCNEIDTTVLAIKNLENNKVEFLLEKTPFYAESGGQISDLGLVYNEYGKLEVYDVIKLPDNRILHRARLIEGSINANDKVKAKIARERRQSIKKHHTATHLLHKALKEVLGEHVNQAGSLVTPEKLRFDFTHFSALTKEELNIIEDRVNEVINKGFEIKTEVMNLEQAMNEGAVALFDEKYDEKVRVVSTGDYTKELCGGTHVKNTSEIGQFIILSEGSIGSGIRRIEAIAGLTAHKYLKDKLSKLIEVKDILKVGQVDVEEKAKELMEKLSLLEKENQSLQHKLFNYTAQDIIDNGQVIGDVLVINSIVDVSDMESLRDYADVIKAKKPESVITLGCEDSEKVYLLVAVSDKIVKEKGLNAGKIIKDVAKICDGGGGGRPQMAQAGGKTPEKLPDAVREVPSIVKKFLDI
ncbi:MAG: alanine--tRNA ligase [Clostridia bacterium]